MGFFKQIKQSLDFIRTMKAEMIRQQEMRQTYVSISPAQMVALPNEELFAAATARIDAIADGFDDVMEGFQAMSEHQRLVYALNYWQMEVNNGGLCQFFVNSSRCLAPYIGQYLRSVGADNHADLYEGFIRRNGIDTHDLSSFQISRVKDFEAQTQRYPFDTFDDAFYELPGLEELLTAYIRTHADAF